MALIIDVVDLLPPEWATTVTVERGGGLDRFGQPKPATTHDIERCLIGEATTEEADQFSEVAQLDAILSGPVAADLTNTDIVRSPASAFAPARTWRVAGHPFFGPLGTKAPLSLEP